MIISLRARVAAHLMRPTRDSGFYTRKRAASPLARLSLLGLAPDGGYLANRIAADAGGLLHHRFTLTLSGSTRRYVSVALSGGLPRPGYYPTSRSLECGLSSALTRQSRDHPTDLAHLYHTENFGESQAGGRCRSVRVIVRHRLVERFALRRRPEVCADDWVQAGR